MSETETIEGEVAEQLGQALELAERPPATLFRTDDPAEIIRRASATATALADVLRKQQLVSRIGNREHVSVEGWTLLGTMLGVFPVCVWSRKLEDGWEARVEARTRDGAVVGAAEAECLRSEKTWANRDDYALRSMAQTRATSKALRQPLGFVVQMAGFEATPAEEIPAEANERRVEGPQPTPVPKSWAKLGELVEKQGGDATAIFSALTRSASYHLFGLLDLEDLDKQQKALLFQKAAGAAVAFCDATPGPNVFPPASVDDWQKAWASVMDGTLLEIPDYKPADPQAEMSEAEKAEVERLAAEAITG